jgi:hypothetical protein
MEEAGLIPTVPEQDRLLPGRVYRREDVDAFVDKLEGKVKPCRGSRANLVTIKTLARQGKFVSELLAAVLDGTLVPVGVDDGAQGVDRLLFPPLSVARTFRTDEYGMSVREAAYPSGGGR